MCGFMNHMSPAMSLPAIRQKLTTKTLSKTLFAIF